ncbi:MAG: hypothetical protein ACOH2M_33920 [Cypionkella sp.]
MADIDHCAEATRLRAILTALATGDSIQSARFGEDEVRYFKGDPDALQRQIDYHERLCAGPTVRRKRFAMRGRYTRPY